MEISEVRIKLLGNPNDRLKAFCTITFDDVFVVRDLKIVDGGNGLFVAMPSRRVLSPCPACRHKNPSKSRFCNGCGAPLPEETAPVDSDAQTRQHRDIAHPINSEFRKIVQDRVLAEFAAECEPEAEGGSSEVEERGFGLREETEQREAPQLVNAVEVSEESGEKEEEPISEYGSMIADLRGGPSGSRGRPPVSRGRGGGGPRSGDGPRRPRQDGPRREDRGGVDSGERRAPRDRVEASDSGRGGPRRGPGSERVAAGTDNDREVSKAVAATPAPAPTPAPPRPAVRPPTADDAAGGFGMGILSGDSASRPAKAETARTDPPARREPPRGTTPPPPKRVVPEEPTPTAPPEAAQPVSDDDDAFGAGLL